MQIPQLIKQHYLVASIAVGVLALALIFGGGQALENAGSYFASSKIQKLEQKRQDAEKQNLILQGEQKAAQEEIGRLNERLKESDQRVVDATQRTTTAQTSYGKARAAGPTFNAVDDSGRVSELRAILDSLYPDPPTDIR